MKPDFADNRELTMAAALCGHMDWLAETYKKPIELSIATGYFNPEGFAVLASRLEKLERVRLLIGAEPVPPPAIPVRMPGDPRGVRFEERRVKEALGRNAEGLLRDRDRLPFDRDTDRCVRRLIDFLSTGRIEVRRYERSFLHGKAFIFGDEEGLLSGSSNFTAAGLISNMELNLGRYDPAPVARVKRWFDELWAEAVPYDLASIYAERYEKRDPYLIYLRVLWERYKDELVEQTPVGTPIRLTTFQNDGIFRAQRIIEKHSGVIIADGVGLGKTFIGGELIRQAVQDRRQRALLVAPATLRDGTWARFADIHQLYLDCVSYEELAQDSRLGGDRICLKQDPNQYALVIVDEAQAFRNPDTRRAQALRRLLQGKPPKTLVLMTATPVNNSLWDLYYLLTYFIGHDAAFSDVGIRSLKDRFIESARMDPDDLRPDALFDILDATTVRRTRHFVRRYYPNDRVIGPGGIDMPVQFPDPHVRAVNYSFDEALPGFFDEFAAALAPAEGDPGLTLARYTPRRYRRTGEPQEGMEAALTGLLRSGLLKRFESSVRAFAYTAERMAKSHDIFLEALDRGFIMDAAVIDEWAQMDGDEAFETLLETSGVEKAEDYDTARLKADAEHDRDLLRRFADRAKGVEPDRDPKLQQLTRELESIIAQARKEGAGEEDIRDKRKVIIFSYFSDTVDWIVDYLKDKLNVDTKLAEYRGRLASVSGDESRGGISREDAVFGFAPRSSEAPAGKEEDRFDILITTDVLAEGVNLQQARHIINFDLPWNPMRLVQRHGRIDRIGSPHRDVFLTCFFPDRRLDDLLTLESRIRRKLAQAAASVGVEHEVIPGAATSDQVFTETRKEIEKLRRENGEILENAGEDPIAHSGEEYRQELRKGLERYGDQIMNLPGGAGSGFRGGALKGHFFCAKVGDRTFTRFMPVDGGDVVRDSLGCLRLISCNEDTEYHLSEEMVSAAYQAWAEAKVDILNEWTAATDPANLQPRVRHSLKAAADQLRKEPPVAVDQAELDRLVESLEAPWGGRIERSISGSMDGKSGQACSLAIIERIHTLGLQPYVPPAPLPPIEEDDIHLICWMGVETA